MGRKRIYTNRNESVKAHHDRIKARYGSVYNYHKNKPGYRIGQLRASAKKRGLLCTLTPGQYRTLVAQPCHYCGRELPKTGGCLDRLDNDLGYEMTNVVPCCPECNSIRGEWLTPEEMKEVALLLKRLRA
jgi:hypothetical protein